MRVLPRLRPSQRFVLDSMRRLRLEAQPSATIRFVVGETAFVPAHLRIPFKRQDVRRHAVEEPAIVADHHRAAAKFLQRLFQRPQRVDIQIVGWLVEQKHIGAGLQHPGQMHAVALAAGQARPLSSADPIRGS